MDYEQLLDKAIKDLPDVVHEKKRFEIPPIRGRQEGNTTILTNLIQIASHLHRDIDHMLKFLFKELATPGKKKGSSIILGAKIPSSKINEKIQKYVEEYVFCKECGKPDTKLESQKDITYMKCMACGAKHPVKR